MRSLPRIRHRSVALLLATLALLLAGCGSSISKAQKQGRIVAALRKLEREAIAAKTEAVNVKGTDVLGVVTLFYEPPPSGVSKAEWDAAIRHDTRLRLLEREASVTAVGGPTMIELATPAAVAKTGGQELSDFEAGKKAVAQSGCLACHKIGENGNRGPGPDLTEVANRLPRRAIERTLVKPTAPMPSFVHLPPQKFHAIVAFLSQLK
jgi:mono/diheme cytochrome c family protein